VDGRVGAGSAEAPSADGRRRRRQQSGKRILQALADAICELETDVTPERIAARSGYSVSTIFRHFGSRDGLTAAMQELIRSRVREHLAAGPFEGDVHARVSELARRLAAVFETVTPFLRAVAHNPQRTHLDDPGRRWLDEAVRGQIAGALAKELAVLPEDTADILAAVLSVGAWSHMRGVQRHSAEHATELLESAVLGLLGADPA
jgi:AcrR family transcriptional regulator